MNVPTWSPQQSAAIDKAGAWMRQCDGEMKAGRPLSQQVFRIFGYGGTGKSFLVRHLAHSIGGTTVYAAFTGKAAMVMRRSGCENATTIHSLIYNFAQDAETGRVQWRLNADSEAATANMIAIDEVSMVDAQLGNDLLSFGRPVLVLGDPGQLPPVVSDYDRERGTGAGFFIDAEPDVMLTEIHRQALDSPIIQLATIVREGGRLQLGRWGDSEVMLRKKMTNRMVLTSDQVLVGRNDTRNRMNARIREMRGYTRTFPETGERLVCLKNNRQSGIFNGGMFDVVETDHQTASQRAANRMSMSVKSVDMDRPPIDVTCRVECWDGDLMAVDWRDKKGCDEFDFGYALTVHKAQGSQWDHVLVIDESGVFRDEWRKWLYTAISRAAQSVIIVMDGE